jgi:hypothetical protein
MDQIANHPNLQDRTSKAKDSLKALNKLSIGVVTTNETRNSNCAFNSHNER